MADIVRDVTQVGLFSNLKNAIVGFFVGILFFFGSFGLLFWNEGRVNLAAVAKTAVVASADKVDAGLDGKLVSVTGAIAAKETVGDPDLVRPGPWVRLAREVQTFAWVETKKKESHDKLGGGTEEITTYTYKTDWTNDVQKSSDFREPAGHANPTPFLLSKSFLVPEATVGAYRFAPDTGDGVDTAKPLELTPALAIVAASAEAPEAAPRGNLAALAGRAVRLEATSGQTYLFIGTGTLAAPKVGDTRLSYAVMPTGTNVTLFGRAKGDLVEPFPYTDSASFLRCLVGGREEAIHTLAVEDAMIRWLLRGLGFLLMWIGMSMVLHPIVAVANIIPFLGEATRTAIGCVTFPIALTLSAVTIVVSLVLHSLVATAIVGVVVLAIAVAVLRSRKPPTPAAPPAV